MVTLTDVAQTRIRDIIKDTPEAQGKMLRLFVEGGGCGGFQYGFAFDDEHDGDTVVPQEGFAVAIDPASAMQLAGVKIDYVQGPQGEGFRIENPATSGGGCNCGSTCSA